MTGYSSTESSTPEFSAPEENTLGTVVGKRSRSGGGTTGGARALRQASARGATLGTRYVGIGATIICASVAVFCLVLSLLRIGDYPNFLPVLAAWILFAATIIAASVTASAFGERMPNWLFALTVVALCGVVALDLAAIWPLRNVGAHATASIAAGFGLLVVITLRKGREVVAVSAVFGAAFTVAILLTTPLTAETIPGQVGVVALVVLPGVFGVYVVRSFRRMVQLELDRVLVQSTVSAPRFAVGMLASEELARLDLAAEELLESVALGRTKLPLGPKTASTAASLATELRLHLIEGRRETWLYHAVTESEMLGKSVTLSDKGSLAGLLDSTQRDGLLSAVWLLVSDTSKASQTRTVELTIGPATTTVPGVAGNRIVVPIVILTTGVARNRVDPATWDSFSKVGRYSDSTQNSSLRVDIECLVDNPADK